MLLANPFVVLTRSGLSPPLHTMERGPGGEVRGSPTAPYIRKNLELLDYPHETHIANLDAALNIIAKVGILYHSLESSEKKELLRLIVERVVVNPEGMILRLELLPPFAYLRHVTQKVDQGGKTVKAKTRTSGTSATGSGSDKLRLGDPGRIRTFGTPLKRRVLYH